MKVNSKNDTIRLLRPENKEGVIIRKEYYLEIVKFLLATIEKRHDNGISLNDMLDEVNQDDSLKTPGRDIFWIILQVKQDLEARGVIKTLWVCGRIQFIHINRKKWNSFLLSV
jgi:hypothetical protein